MTDQTSIHEEIARLKASSVSRGRPVAPHRTLWWRFIPPMPHPLVSIDDRVVRLRLTWRRLDTIGHNGVRELFATATSGEAGAMQATADLLELFSAGEIGAPEAMERPLRLEVAITKLYEAWLLAQYGPPKGRLRGWWAHLTNRPVPLAIC